MKFRHVALLVVTALFASVAMAQTCTLTMGPLLMYQDGKVKFEERGQVYYNMTPDAALQIVQRSQKLLDEAYSARGHVKKGDPKGEFMMTVEGKTDCLGVPISTAGPYDGLNYDDFERLLRIAYHDISEGHFKQFKAHHGKGHKGPWGKE